MSVMSFVAQLRPRDLLQPLRAEREAPALNLLGPIVMAAATGKTSVMVQGADPVLLTMLAANSFQIEVKGPVTIISWSHCDSSRH